MPDNSLPPVIGFTGTAGSGKSTAANWVLRNHNQSIRMTFAEPIKRMTREFLRAALPKGEDDKSSAYVSDPVLKNEPIPFIGGLTARYLMQTLGTEWGRNTIHPDFWVGIAAGKLERLMGSSFKKTDSVPIKAVFDDVRFANEVELIRAHGGLVVRIMRPEDPAVDAPVHASETLDLTPDLVITNDGTIEDLERCLADVFPPQKKAPKKRP